MIESTSGSNDGSLRCSRATCWILILIGGCFLLVRLPALSRQPGGQDEEWYAVPGFTVATEGIPRIPYVPERRRESVFFKADKVVTTLPPAFFYWQAPWFWLLPAGYGTARLPSAIAGLVSIWLVYRLARQISADEWTALGAAALYSLSRVFYFPATMARPDMLCGLWGLGALSCAWTWSHAPTRSRLAVTGVLCGLGLLTHPFAIVYCLQIGVWVLWASGGGKRSVGNGALLTAVALLVFALWLPLILIDTDVFREQFVDNVFNRAGPGLVGRLLWPLPYFREQAGLMWEHAGAWQFVLMLAGLAYVGSEAVRRRTSADVALALLAGSSVYLMVACLGLHPAKGYWCYPGALLMICLARMLAGMSRVSVRRGVLLRAGIWTAALLVMLPGLGLRTWAAHVRHWNDENYNSFRFARQIAGRFAPEERLLVDPAYVFDVWLVHPHVLLAAQTDSYFRAEQFEFDWLIVGRYGLDNDLPSRLGTTAVARFGARDDLFSCYAEVHAPRRQAAIESAAVSDGVVWTAAGTARGASPQAVGGASHSRSHVPF